MLKIRNRLTAVLAAATVLLMQATPLQAGTTYAPVAGEQTQFDKYLVMKEGANVPNVGFAFSIAKGTAVPYSDGHSEILEGVGTPTISWDDSNTDSIADFKAGDATISASAADRPSTDYVKNLGSGEKYAKHTATVDFTGVSFPEPGIYRYVITETASTAPGITNDSDLTRTLDVYVLDDSTETAKKLKVDKYILHAGDVEVPADKDAGTEASDYKSQGFTNKYETYDLTFSKTVTGNKGSKDKYFKFTLNVEGAVPGTKYDLSYADDGNSATTDGNADSVSGNNTATKSDYRNRNQPTSPLLVGSDGKVSATFYLQHGQKIAVRGIAPKTKYSIEEDKENYSPSATADEGTISESKDKVTVAEASKDNVAAFTNNNEGTPATGVVLAVLPFAAVIGIGCAAVLASGRRRRDDED